MNLVEGVTRVKNWTPKLNMKSVKISKSNENLIKCSQRGRWVWRGMPRSCFPTRVTAKRAQGSLGPQCLRGSRARCSGKLREMQESVSDRVPSIPRQVAWGGAAPQNSETQAHAGRPGLRGQATHLLRHRIFHLGSRAVVVRGTALPSIVWLYVK